MRKASDTHGLNSEIVICSLALIQSGRGSLEIQALAGEAIAACSRFNIWFLEDFKKRPLNEEITFEILGAYEQATLDYKKYVQKFYQDNDYEELSNSLIMIINKLNKRPDIE